MSKGHYTAHFREGHATADRPLALSARRVVTVGAKPWLAAGADLSALAIAFDAHAAESAAGAATAQVQPRAVAEPRAPIDRPDLNGYLYFQSPARFYGLSLKVNY